ncbi:MAG: hypothetical protein GX351_02115 [Peptococcaceae bacterium]|jgi:hypothetical protein|nr:hypothetical protein [Peptococcaceae bacterium]
MLLENKNPRMNLPILLLLITLVITLTACSAPKGSIVILALNKGDELQIEVIREIQQTIG